MILSFWGQKGLDYHILKGLSISTMAGTLEPPWSTWDYSQMRWDYQIPGSNLNEVLMAAFRYKGGPY